MRQRLLSPLASLGLLVSLFALGCGSTDPEAPRGSETSGAENVAPEATRPAPPRSYLPDSARVVARLDMARVRRSPLAPDIASAIRATSMWQRLAGRSGVDPVQDFDAILVGGDELYTDRRVVVLRHPHTEAEIRQRLLAMAVDSGTAPAWRDVEGFPAIAWPIERSSVTYSLVITAPHELVLAPDDDLARIVAVARDHAARRAPGSDAVVEPHLASARATEIATVTIDLPLPGRAGYPTPPQRTRVDVDERADGAAVLAIRAEFADASEAEAARSWLDGMRTQYAQQAMVRAIGMHRPLEEATVALSGTELALGADLTVDELRRALGLMALSQLAQAAQ